MHTYNIAVLIAPEILPGRLTRHRDNMFVLVSTLILPGRLTRHTHRQQVCIDLYTDIDWQADKTHTTCVY